MLNKITLVLLLAAGGALALLLVTNVRARSGGKPTTAPQPSPAWELKDVDGKTVKSADFKGKVVILDFWAAWCPPCRAEIPGFIELRKKYQNQGLVVAGVSLDQGGAAGVKKFMEKEGVNYPVLLGSEEVVRAFGGVEAIPTTFIIDRKGRIAGKHEGFTDKDDFEKEIKPLLKP